MKKINLQFAFKSVLVIGGAIVLLSATINTEIKSKSIASPLAGEWIAPASADTIKNPLKGNVPSIDVGKKLYVKFCVVCHGEKGKGDGVASAGLTPRPADHSSEKIQAQTDGALFWKLTTGRAPMASYKQFTTEQRWALVNYMRTLKAPGKSKK